MTRREAREQRAAAEAQALSPTPSASRIAALFDAPTEEGDAFDAAARLFAFTGPHAVQPERAEPVRAEADPDVDAAAPGIPSSADRRLSRLSVFRRLSAASFSVGVLGVVGLLTIGMTTPVAAVAAAQGTTVHSASPAAVGSAAGDASTAATAVVTAAGAVEVDAEEIQAYVAPAVAPHTTIERTGSYATVSMADIATDLGILRHTDFYVNDMSAAIQWPFAVGVGITWGYGMRDGRLHAGADFDPGDGALIQAVADGVVRVSTNNGASYGSQVIIDHIIDGQLVSTRYAHMQYNSMKVSVGDEVKVGQVLGLTGNTGRSFGSHLHLEVLMGGDTAIDPIAWLRENAGRTSLD